LGGENAARKTCFSKGVWQLAKEAFLKTAGKLLAEVRRK
jgi:hypothetical protein